MSAHRPALDGDPERGSTETSKDRNMDKRNGDAGSIANRTSRTVLALATTGALTADAIHSLSQPLGVIGLAVYNMETRVAAGTADPVYLGTTLRTLESQIDKSIDLIRGFQGLRGRLQASPSPLALARASDQAIALCAPVLAAADIEATGTGDGIAAALEVPDGALALAIMLNMVLYGLASLPMQDTSVPPAKRSLALSGSRHGDNAKVLLKPVGFRFDSSQMAAMPDKQAVHRDILLALLAHAGGALAPHGNDAVVTLTLPVLPG